MSYRNISPEDAKSKLEESEMILLDVRTKEEYEKEHIPNSILIPLNNLKNEAPNKLKNKEQGIVIYCSSGNRSKEANQILSNLGYKNLYNLQGGINDWKYETK